MFNREPKTYPRTTHHIHLTQDGRFIVRRVVEKINENEVVRILRLPQEDL